jgi:Na+/H+-dicarboxylate symporter
MLHFAIAVGLLLGLAVGLGASITGNSWLHAIAGGSAPFGAVFMNAIKMVVIPLIVTVIFTSVARLGDPRRLGRIGGLTLAFYCRSRCRRHRAVTFHHYRVSAISSLA